MIHRRIDIEPYLELVPLELVVPPSARARVLGPGAVAPVVEPDAVPPPEAAGYVPRNSPLEEHLRRARCLERLVELRRRYHPEEPEKVYREKLSRMAFHSSADPALEIACTLRSQEAAARAYGSWQGPWADAMVWSVGEGPDPRATRIGGAPIWPKAKPWPKSRQGDPMQFFFQINFSDSTDLVPGLPGDILTVLWEQGEESIYCEGEDSTSDMDGWYPAPRSGCAWQAYWLKNDEPLRRVEDEAVMGELGAIHASLLRVQEWRLPWHLRQGLDDDLEWQEGLEVCKIGGVPHWPQDDDWPLSGAGSGAREKERKEVMDVMRANDWTPRQTHFLGGISSYMLGEKHPGFSRDLYKTGKSWEIVLGDLGTINMFWDPREVAAGRRRSPDGHITMKLQHH